MPAIQIDKSAGKAVWSLSGTGPPAPKRTTPSVRTWPELMDDLLAMHLLDADWDGQGAKVPPAALVDGATGLLQFFQLEGWAPADRVIAGVNGTIHFEWHGPDEYIEIEVTAPDRAEGRLVKKGSNETETFVLRSRS